MVERQALLHQPSATYDVVVNIANPTRTGYTFTGWTATNLNTSTAKYGTSSSAVSTAWSNASTKVTATYFKNLTATSGATVTLTANWQIKTYKLTVSKTTGINSVSTGLSGSSPYYVAYNTSISVSASVDAGYTFSGWTISGATLSTSASTNANSFSMPAKEVTLTATAKANTYQVRFNKNSIDASGSMSNQSFTYNVAQNLTKCAFVRVGYTMKWNTKADGSGTTYADSAKVMNLTTVSNEVINLYAIWTKANYTISFNANGGVCGVASKSLAYGSTISDLPTPTRTGYTFGGWYAEFDGSTDFINMGRDYMYTDKFSVHLSAYSDNWSNVANARLVSCTDNGGWNIEGNNGCIQFAGYDYQKGYKPALSTTKWQNLSSGWHTFDYIFDGNYIYGYLDGTLIAQSAKFESGRLGYNSTNSIMLGAEATASATTVSTNYFDGYIGNFVINNNTARVTNADNMLTVPAQNLTLYARWTANTYKVTLNNMIDSLNNNRADNVSGTAEFYYQYQQTKKSADGKITYYYYTNANCNIDSGLSGGYYITCPKSPGYTFEGYYTVKKSNATGSQIKYIDETGKCINNIYRSVAGNTTLYAWWEVNTYTVSFDANGGNSLSAMTFDAGQRLETGIVWDYNKSTTIVGSFMMMGNVSSRYLIIGSYPGSSVQVEIYNQKIRLFCENTISAEKRDVKGTTDLSSGVWYLYTLDYNAITGTMILSLMSSDGEFVDSVATEVANTSLVATRSLVVGAKDYRGDVNSSDTNPFVSISVVQDYAVSHLLVPISATQWKDLATNTTFSASGTLLDLSSTSIEYNSQYGALPTPSKSKVGYDVEFLGWFTEKTGGTQILDTSIMKNAGNQTLYAHWKETARTYNALYLNYDQNLAFYSVDGTNVWTHNNTEHIYTTVQGKNGPYISNLNLFMQNGATYRIYFYAKISTGTFSVNSIFEAGDNSTRYTMCNLTTTYQRFYIETKYNSSATYKALTFYSSNWAGQQLYIKDIQIAKMVSYDSTYDELPTPTRTGYTFEGWSNQIFNFQECLRSISDSNSENGKVTRDLVNNSITLVSNTTDFYTNPWNGTSYYVNVLPNTKYTFSWKQTGDEGITVKNLIFMCNNTTTSYTTNVGGAGAYNSTLNRYYITFVTSSTTTVLRFRFGLYESVGKTATLSQVKLEKGATPTAYFITKDSIVKSNFDHELEAIYKSNTFNIEFDKNQPSTATSSVSGTMANMTNIIYDVANKLSKNVYSLTGWTFKGWAIASGGDVKYTDNQALTVEQVDYLYGIKDSSSVTTLYAKWQANKYSVKFEKNPPSNTNAVGGTMANQEFTYDQAKNLTTNAYTLVGYTFNGWNAKADGTGTAWGDGASVKNLTTSGTISLYAQWKAKTYTITYNGNATAGDLLLASLWNYAGTGGYTSTNSGSNAKYTTSGVTATTKSQYNIAFDKQLSYCSPIPVRRGYTFNGWFTSATGGTKLIESGASTFNASVSGYTNASKQWIKDANVTLYAQWTAKTYNITYDYASGTKGSNNPTSYTVANGVSVSDPTRVGYTFAGWKITASLSKMNNATINLNSGEQQYSSSYPDAVYYELFYLKYGTQYTGVKVNNQIRWRAYNISTGAFIGGISANTNPSDDGKLTEDMNIALWYHEGNSNSTATIEFSGVRGFTTADYKTTGNLKLVAQWTINTYDVHILTGAENLLNENAMAVQSTYSGHNCTGTYDPKDGGTWTISPTNTTDPFMQLSQTVELTAGKVYYFHMTIRNTDGSIPTSGSMQLFIGLNGSYSEACSVRFKLGGGIASFKAPTTGTYKLRMDNDYAGTQKVVTNFWVAQEAETSYKKVSVEYGASYNLSSPNRAGHTFNKWILATGGLNIYDATDTSKHKNTDYTLSNVSPYVATISGTTLTLGAGDVFVFATYNRNAYEITITTNDATLGTVDLASIKAYDGAKVSTSDNKLTIGTTTITATAKSIAGYTILHSGWSSIGGNIVSARTITAEFTKNGNGINIALDNQGATSAGTAKVYFKFGTGSYFTELNGTDITSTGITCPSKIGYTFGGYYAQKSGAGTQYISENGKWKNDLYKSITTSSTLYAKWTANKYKVTLDNQGATTAGTTAYYYYFNTTKTINNQLVYYYSDEKCESPLNNYTITLPTKTGYTFGGYFTEKNGVGTNYVDTNGMCIGNLYKNVANNIILYAKWTANTYTVTFDSNGGDSMAVGKIPQNTRVETNIKMDYSKSLIITGLFAIPVANARYFVIGNYGGNSLQVEVNTGNKLRLYCENATTLDTAGTKTLTVGVVYSYRLEYNALTKSLTLKGYNGDGTEFETLSTTIKDTTKVSTNNFAVGTRDYRSTNSSDTTFASIILGTTTIVSGSNSAYKIVPVATGLSINGTTKVITGYSNYLSTSTKSVTYDKTYGDLPTPTKVKEGYTITFIGWFTAKTGGAQVKSSTAVKILSNQTLYARYTETANVYKVMLDNQGATTAGTSAYYYKFNTRGANGEYFYADANLTTKLGDTSYTITLPKRTGYTFGGYFTEKNGAGTQYINASGVCINNLWSSRWDNITLYAKWTVNSYTITFDGNGSEVQYAITWNYAGGGNYTSSNSSYSNYSMDTTKANRTLNYGTTLGINSPIPVRRGYTFNGWFTSATGGTKLIESGASTFNASVSGYTNASKQWIKDANVTLYAQWTSKTYNITYDYASGTKGSNNPTSYTVANGVSVSDPTRVGYTFAGWKITATLSQVNKAYIEMNAGYQFYDSGYPNAVIYEPFYVKTGTTYTVPLGNGEVRWRNYNATTGAYLGNISSSTSFAGNNSNIAIWYHKGNSTSGATTTTITFNSGTAFETSTYSVTGNLNLTAQWTANKYFVKFEKNPPSSTTSVSGTMANQEFTYDQAKALTTNVYTAVDYNFKYWSTKKDGTGKLYINSHTIENLTTTNNATITLYAQWEKIIYTINFECYGEYSFNDIYIILNGKKYYGINYSITYIPGTEIEWYYNDMDGMKSTTQEQSSVDGITTKITTTSTQGVQVSIGDVEDEPTYNTGSSAISKSGAITLSRDDNGKVIKVCHVRQITTKMTPGGISTTVDNGTIPTKEGLTEEPLVYKWELNWAYDQEYGNQTVYVKADNTSKLYSNQSCTTEATIKTSFGSYTFKGYYTGEFGTGNQYITSSGKRKSSSAKGDVKLYAYLIPRELSVSVYLTDIGHSNSQVYSSASDTKTGYYLYYLVAFTGNRISDFYIWILSEKSNANLTTTEASYHYSCVYNISQQITIEDSTSSTTLNESFDGWAMGIVKITIEYATSTASLSNLELDGHMSAYSDNVVAVVLDGESNSVSETAQVWLDDKFRKLQQKQDVVVDFDGVSFDT